MIYYTILYYLIYSTLLYYTYTFLVSSGDDAIIEPYGVILYTCVIRDLGAVGFEHVGSKGQEIIQCVINVASPNYPGII